MLTLKLNETMSGWMQLNSRSQPEALAFSIQVIFASRLQCWKPQPFTGVLRLEDAGVEVPTRGFLTFKLSGPRYELGFEHPGLGWLELRGEKNYALNNLKQSLTVCPLTVFEQGAAIGYAEVAYRDSILAFPFRSVRLTLNSANL